MLFRSESEAYRRLQKMAMEKRSTLATLARAVVAQESGREVIRRAKELLIRTAALSEPEAYRAVTAFAKERGLSPEEAAQLILDRGGLPK